MSYLFSVYSSLYPESLLYIHDLSSEKPPTAKDKTYKHSISFAVRQSLAVLKYSPQALRQTHPQVLNNWASTPSYDSRMAPHHRPATTRQTADSKHTTVHPSTPLLLNRQQ